LVLDQDRLKVQIVAVVSGTGLRLFKVLSTVGGKLTYVLRASEIDVYDGERGDFLDLGTSGDSACLIPKSHGSEMGTNTHDRVLFVHTCVCVPESFLRW